MNTQGSVNSDLQPTDFLDYRFDEVLPVGISIGAPPAADAGLCTEHHRAPGRGQQPAVTGALAGVDVAPNVWRSCRYPKCHLEGDHVRNEPGGHPLGLDDQPGLKEPIKYNGHQVAPVELKGMLSGHPAVADAVVVDSPDERILRRVLVKRDRPLIAGVR